MYFIIEPKQKCTLLEEFPDISQNNQGNTSVKKNNQGTLM
jgi:hypothetical protein